MTTLPKGWVEASAEDVCEVVQSGGTPKAGFVEEAGIPFLKVYNIVDQKVSFDYRPQFVTPDINTAVLGKSRAKPGDVIMNIVGPPLGKVAIIPNTYPEWNINQAITLFRPSDAVSSEWLYILLRSGNNVAAIKKETRGIVGQVNISLSQCRNFQFPIPPVPEQKRIITKVESLTAKSARARAELDRISSLADKYKNAVLSAAFSGALTQDWRRMHEREGSARTALFEIRQKRQQHRKLSRRKAVERIPSLEIPASWTWISPDEIAADDTYSIGIGPFGSNLMKSDYQEQGTRLVFVRDIRRESFGHEDARYITPEKAGELHPHTVRGGDVLITKMGVPPGDSALYPEHCDPAIITADCIKLSPHRLLASAIFLVFCIRSDIVRRQIVEITAGVAQQKVSLDRFRRIGLPIPPLEEQREIVRRIEAAFAKIDRLAAEAKRALELTDRLDERILVKAFRGELVPQDPNDEPASGLLERIRAGRATAPKARRGRARASAGEK